MAKRGSGAITGNKRANVLDGMAGADRIEGRGGDDTLEGGAGGDWIDGGAGADVAVFDGLRDDYAVLDGGDGTIRIVGADGTDTVTGVETFRFADMTQTAAEVVLPRLANLRADALTLDDASLAPREGATATFRIASDGTIDADASRYELVVATAPDAGAVVAVLDTGEAGALATGGAATYQASVPAGSLEAGTYWVAVRADADDALAEEDEGDNLTEWVELVVEAPVADLRLDGATLGARTDLDLDGGGRIQMTYDYANAGNVSPSYFTIRTYLSTDETVSADDKAILGITGGTTAGRDGSVTTSYWFQSDFPAGDYYLISEIAWGDGSADATPGDNRIVQQVTFAPPSTDLAVTGVTVAPGSDLLIDADGASVDVTVDVANLGGVAAGTTLTAYLSTDGTISADDIAVTASTGSVGVGGARSVGLSFELDADAAPGDYTILVALSGGDDDATNDTGAAGVTLEAQPVIRGTEGADLLSGTSGDDRIEALGGDDVILASAGADSIDGGAGRDRVDLSGATGPIDVYADWTVEGPSAALVHDWASGTTTVLTEVEALTTTAFADYVDLTNTAVTEVDLGDGDDVVYGGDAGAVIRAGAGADQVLSALGDDVVSLGEGADLFAVERWSVDGGTLGRGADVVTDFDPNADILYIEVEYGQTYDPFADVVQTADGALIAYADDSSVLLAGVDAEALTAANLIVAEAGGGAGFLY